MMKPFMIKAFVEELDACSWEQKAIAVASHNGDTEHVAAAQSLLNESEWPLMLTPLDVPLIQFGRQVRRPRRWYHVLGRACRHPARLPCEGMEPSDYTLPSHEVFHAYMQQIRRFLGKTGRPSHCQRRLRPAHGVQHGGRVGGHLRRLGRRPP